MAWNDGVYTREDQTSVDEAKSALGNFVSTAARAAIPAYNMYENRGVLGDAAMAAKKAFLPTPSRSGADPSYTGKPAALPEKQASSAPTRSTRPFVPGNIDWSKFGDGGKGAVQAEPMQGEYIPAQRTAAPVRALQSDLDLAERDRFMQGVAGGSGVGDAIVAQMFDRRYRKSRAAEQADTAEDNQMRRAAASEIGALSRAQMGDESARDRMEREYALRRELAGEERAYNAPVRDAALRVTNLEAEGKELGMADQRVMANLNKQIDDPTVDPKLREAAKLRRDTIYAQKNAQIYAAEAAKQRARNDEPYTGEYVEGRAEGGLIGGPDKGALAQYGQYLQAAASTGVPPVPYKEYVGLLQTTRKGMQQTPAMFSEGGEVEDEYDGRAIPVGGRMVRGPGTGTSDSIPAVINGERPAALSDGEFVIPAHVVRAKGTEFFEKLLAQYADKE